MTTKHCNKAQFCEEKEGIYRLKIPFDTLYTSIFLLECDGRRILLDTASNARDVDQYLTGALGEMGLALSDVDTVVLSHGHADHAGGLARILELAPAISVVRDVCRLTEQITVYPMLGHTKDCVGLFDARTGTLIAADGLQGAGIDRYRVALEDADVYRTTIERIRQDAAIQEILFSHAYEPWYRDHACGRDEILRCLCDCEANILKWKRNENESYIGER